MSIVQHIYNIENLAQYHNRRFFSCGVEPLDLYLHNQASQDVSRHIAAVFVLVENGSCDVIGYYTLSAMAVDAGDLPEQLTRKLPKYKLLPATLLGRLVIDKRYQKKRLGELLVTDALTRVMKLSREIASMAVIVDAKDEAAANFYEYYGFIRFHVQKKKLFLALDTAIKASQ